MMELTEAENTDGFRKRQIQALKAGHENTNPDLAQRSTYILLSHLITPAMSESGTRYSVLFVILSPPPLPLPYFTYFFCILMEKLDAGMLANATSTSCSAC